MGAPDFGWFVKIERTTWAEPIAIVSAISPRDQVANGVRRAILSQGFEPGDQLRQAESGVELVSSSSPIREALLR
jgi:DNA-binding GntR family transcriptional regulator